jgi:hypothetical protein
LGCLTKGATVLWTEVAMTCRPACCLYPALIDCGDIKCDYDQLEYWWSPACLVAGATLSLIVPMKLAFCVLTVIATALAVTMRPTPHGMRPAECVLEVPSGSRIGEENGHVRITAPAELG